MKIKSRQLLSVLIAMFAAGSLWAAGETPPPAPAPAPAPAAAPAVSEIQTAMMPIVEKIKAKFQAGQRTEAALADEIKAIDAVIAANKGKDSEEFAQVYMLKVVLYLQVFQNFEKGEAVLKQIKADCPAAAATLKVDAILAEIASKKEAEKMKSSFVPGAVFPDFEEKDLDGKPLSIAKFKGKIVLVDFWATWCGPCVAELPNVLAAYAKYHDKGFEVIGISLDKDEAKLKTFIADKKMPWPQFFDGKGWQNKLGQKYGIDSIPATFLLDGEGKIIAKGLRGEALEAEIAKHLGK